jgi:hypothetical protein
MGTAVILPDLILPNKINQHWEYSGIDSFEHCLDKNHFKQYPYAISYNYNSRGFRDQEWPNSVEELKSAIWCVGDSFTVGVGSPIEHTWPWLLQKQTGRRVINISMDGASNNWIARKTVDILQVMNPRHVVLHWSYLHRRELDIKEVSDKWWNNFYCAVRDQQWPECSNLQDFDQLPAHIKKEIVDLHGGVPLPSDEDCRLEHQPYATDQDDLDNTVKCIDLVNTRSSPAQLLHSFIPDSFNDLPTVYQHLDQHSRIYIPKLSRLDIARDGHHYDILTSQMFVNQIVDYL